MPRRGRYATSQKGRWGNVPTPPAVKYVERYFGKPEGGGGQAACAISHFNKDIFGVSVDTSAPRITNNATKDNVVVGLGLKQAGAKKFDGLLTSRIDPDIMWGFSGDGTGGVGGLGYITGLSTVNSVSGWTFIGPTPGQAGFPNFNGGNGVGNACPATNSINNGYPRHYFNHGEIDEFTTAGKTYIFYTTVDDGAWRWRIDNATKVVEQRLQFAGTAGKYGTFITFPICDPSGVRDFSRCLIGTYDRSGTAQPVLLCTNANDTSATPTLATTAVTSAGTNMVDCAYVKNATTGNGVTILVGDGKVLLSTNAHTQSAANITWTSVTTGTAGLGPETAEWWISCKTNIDSNGNYLFYVGTKEGGTAGALDSQGVRLYNTGYWGSLSPTGALNTVGWNSWAGKFNSQIMGVTGPTAYWWLYGVNSPGNSGTANISALRVSTTDPSRVVAICRGMTYISDDYGKTFYCSNIWGSADVNGIASDPNDRSRFYMTTGDWPLFATRDQPTDRAFTSGGIVTLHVDSLVNSVVGVSPIDGGVYFSGYYTSGGPAGHSVPNRTDAGGTIGVWRCDKNITQTTWTAFNPTDTSSGANFRNLSYTNNGVFGANIFAGATSLLVGTNPTATADIVWLGGLTAGRMWTYNFGTWTQTTASDGGSAPFTTAGGQGSCHDSVIWDSTRKVGYIVDRNSGILWRVSAASPTSAVPIFLDTWSRAFSPDTYGNIALDVANNTIFVSTPNGVWYATGASTLTPKRDKTNFTATGFTTYFTGEEPGQLFFASKDNMLRCSTVHMTGGSTVIYPVTASGNRTASRGPRFLTITNPTVLTQWQVGAGKTDDTSQDPSYNLSMTTPHGGCQNDDGSTIIESQQGCGTVIIRV